MTNYILKDGVPVLEPDILKWAQWFETADRQVVRTDVPGGFVSTVFLGLDHSLSGIGPPMLYETMVFGDDNGDVQERYSTEAEALVGHERVVNRVSGPLTKGDDGG